MLVNLAARSIIRRRFLRAWLGPAGRFLDQNVRGFQEFAMNHLGPLPCWRWTVFAAGLAALVGRPGRCGAESPVPRATPEAERAFDSVDWTALRAW